MSGGNDGITLALYQNRFRQVTEEMGETLKRSAFSPNIKEREDHSCALFDASGEMLAQAAHIPVHLGAMPATMKAVLKTYPKMSAGDVIIVNDPFSGGTHLPDITLVTPVFHEAECCFYLVTRAHHSDVGGMTPGSMPLSTEVFQEGLILPPVHLFKDGVRNDALWQVILKNTRTPHEREGDLKAQLAAHAIGEQRILELMSKAGHAIVLQMVASLLDYGEEKVREAIRKWPDGTSEYVDHISVPGCPERCQIHCVLKKTKDEVHVDFSQSADQILGPINAVKSIVDSAVYYVCRTLLPPDMPHNGGANRPIKILTRPGSIVDALPPAGVVGGNVETSQRLVDVLYGAWSGLLGDVVPSASQGTMNNLSIGGLDHKEMPYTYYETLAGGHGAHAQGAGLSGRQSHMTNTRNTPIEALEQAFPFWIDVNCLRDGSGGIGHYGGGEGLIRTYVFEKDATVTLFSSRRVEGPYGLSGGAPGQVGAQFKYDVQGGKSKLPDSFSMVFSAGERLEIQTPGGGGFGTFNK